MSPFVVMLDKKIAGRRAVDVIFSPPFLGVSKWRTRPLEEYFSFCFFFSISREYIGSVYCVTVFVALNTRNYPPRSVVLAARYRCMLSANQHVVSSMSC